jgi:hypothetical protein
MANDSGLFQQPDDLTDAHLNGWSYERDGKEYVPLYEGKMLWHFDHRFSTYKDATTAQLNMQTLPRISDAQHDDPGAEPLARHWVLRSDVSQKLGEKWDRSWLLGWRDITGIEKVRTFVPSVLPASAVGDPFLLAFPTAPRLGPILHAIWSSTI